jgi:hypothetical protein
MMASEKVARESERPTPIQTPEDLRRLIAEVRIRLDEALKPAGPLRIFKITTST